MFKKDKMPGVCSAILIGIAAYSNLLTMDVQASELDTTPADDDNATTEGIGDEDNAEDESHNVSVTNEKVYDEEIGADIDVVTSTYDSRDDYEKAVQDKVDGLVSDVADETTTESGSTSYTWTDEGGSTHVVEVTTTETDGEDTVDRTFIKGSTETKEMNEFDHVDENGNDVYKVSETITTDDAYITVTNKNESSTTTITETVSTDKVVQVEGSYEEVINEQGNVTKVYAYDADGNPLVQVKDDGNGNPVLPTAIYDKDNNLIADLSDANSWKYDKDSNAYVYWDDNNKVQYTVECDTVKTQYGDVVYVRPTDGEKTLEETTTIKEATKIECSANDPDAVAEKTGTTHKESCGKDDEGAKEVVTGTESCGKNDDGAYKVGTESCDKNDADAREVITGTETCGKNDVGAHKVGTVPCDANDDDARIANDGETVVKSIYDDDEDLKAIKDKLGDYGITANEVNINEAQTNINTGNIASSNAQTGVHNTIYNPDYDSTDASSVKDDQGYTMRIEDMDDGVKFNFKGNVSEVILGSESLEKQIGYLENTKTQVGDKVTIDTTKSVENTLKEVAELADTIAAKDNSVNADGTTVERTQQSSDHAKYQIDFTSVKNETDNKYDVVYATADLRDTTEATTAAYTDYDIKLNSGVELWQFSAEMVKELNFDPWHVITQDNKKAYAEFVASHGYGTYEVVEHEAETKQYTSVEDGTGDLRIVINENQVAVINIDLSKITNASSTVIDVNKIILDVISADGTKTSYDGQQGDRCLASQQLVLNFGSFSGTIKSAGALLGTIIAPNATFINATTSSGQLACGTYIDGSGEWHYTGNYTWEEKAPTYVKDVYEKNTVSYVKDIYARDVIGYEREVEDVKYYKVVEDTNVANIPLHAIYGVQYKPTTTTETETTKQEFQYTWSSADKTQTEGGGIHTEYTYDTVKPETPETPPETPDTPPETPETPSETPDTPPETPETPAETPTETPDTPEITTVEETPETPQTPPPPVAVIEEPATPLAETPELPPATEETVEIADEKTPLAATTSKTITLLDDDVPLASIPLASSPTTGDSSYYEMFAGFGLAFLSATAGALAVLLSRKRK